MNLKTGGEGLNLQCANRVYLLETWWNPASDHQAIHRSHRIGQRLPVTAIRYVMRGTVEEKMMELQNRKQLLFEGTIDSSASSLAKLSIDDLKFLFA